MRGTEGTGIGTTPGSRQGCPVSCLLFVVVFDIALCHLDLAHFSFVTFVDDITVVVPGGQTQKTAETIQSAVRKIGCQLNVTKSDCLPVQECCSPSSLTTYHHPEPALSIEKGGHSGCFEINTCEHTLPWAKISTAIFKQVDHQMHLGHPSTRRLQRATAYDVLLAEVKEQPGELNAHPIPTSDRVALLSTMVIPRLLYRVECLPLTIEQLQRLNALMKSFVLAVKGLPPHVAHKTTYNHRKIGRGVRYLPVGQPTRALDVIHQHPYMTGLRVGASLPLAPRMVYQTAVAHLKPVTAPPQRPLDVYFQAKRLLPQGRGPQHVLGLEVYEITNTKSSPPEGMVYTDSSKIGQPPSAGASAVAPNGTVYVCHAPGIQCNYRAELLGILFGSYLGPHNSVIGVDCERGHI